MGTLGRTHRNLGFAPIVSPSPDPVSIALDVASGLVALIAFFQGRKARRQAEENDVVHVQNEFGARLDTFSEAAQAPDISADQLVAIHDQLSQLGQDFYNYTLGFGIAGPGARQTIFGDEVAPGVFTATDAHPGWFTRLLDSIKRRIADMLGLEPQLGYDWQRLIDVGVSLGERVGNVLVSGTAKKVNVPIPEQGPPVSYLPNVSTDWGPIAMIGGIALLAMLLLQGGRRRGS